MTTATATPITPDPIPRRSPTDPAFEPRTAPTTETGVAGALTRAAHRTGDVEALHRIRMDLTRNNPEVARELGW